MNSQSARASFSGTVDGQKLTGTASRNPGACSPVVLTGQLGHSTFKISSITCKTPTNIHNPVLTGTVNGIAVHGALRTTGNNNGIQLYGISGTLGTQHISAKFGIPGGGGPFGVNPDIFSNGVATTTATVVITG